MVSGRFKSRTFRRVHRKTPGGKAVIHYKRRKPAPARCVCGAILKGVPRELPFKMKNLPKTKKRPERPYGGVLCSRCLRKKIIEELK